MRVLPVDRLRIVAAAFMLLLFLYAANGARDFPSLSGIYPLAISILGLLLALATLLVDLRTLVSTGRIVETGAGRAEILDSGVEGNDDGSDSGALRYLVWAAAYILLVAGVGMIVGSAVFVLVFLVVEARLKVRHAAVSGAVVAFGLSVMTLELGIDFPTPWFDPLGW